MTVIGKQGSDGAQREGAGDDATTSLNVHLDGVTGEQLELGNGFNDAELHGGTLMGPADGGVLPLCDGRRRSEGTVNGAP